ncbi:MAG TPA: glycosyltransferase 87 family protein [Vicinamibacterales bacterium]|nr:glycosyltransferase 87 family protein [Vicinamibacterales bacterium]
MIRRASAGRLPLRLAVAAFGLASVPGYALDLRAVFAPEVHGLVWYVLLFGGQFVLYLGTAWLVFRSAADDRALLVIVLAFGLLFRLSVLPTAVHLSSDPYRYLWDGRVQRAGVNPYRYPPSAPELRDLRDEAVHPHINRPDKRTIYPPGAEALFAVATTLGADSVVGWRVVLLLFDGLTGALLLRLLHRMARPPATIILWAWAPLAVFEGVQAAHLDPAFVPVLLLALLWRQEGRMFHAGAALGLAVLLKLYPAILLFAWWRKGDRRFPLACAGVVVAGYLPYAWSVGPDVLGFLPEYFGSAEDFNVGLRDFVVNATALGDGVAREVARGVVMLALIAALVVALARIRGRLVDDTEGVFRAARAAVGAYLLLIPTALHAWYAIWMLPFLAVAPSAGWLWFTGAVSLSYLTYAWGSLPFWARALEFFPLYALLARGWRTTSGLTGAMVGDVSAPAAHPMPWERA